MDNMDSNSNLGQTKDVIMGLEDDLSNELGLPVLENKMDPENVYRAGIQGGTRLAL